MSDRKGEVAPRPCWAILRPWPAIEELEKLALELPEKQRAQLAASLLDSLPGVLTDDDQGVSEALRRDRDLESGNSSALSIEQLDALIRSRR